MSAIIDIKAREVLDSRGNPTVEAEVYLEDENTIITTIEDELKDVYMSNIEGNYTIVKVYKNGAAGNLNFMINNNINNTTVTYELLDETESEDGKKQLLTYGWPPPAIHPPGHPIISMK